METLDELKTDQRAIIDRLIQARIDAGFSSPTKFALAHELGVSTYRFHEMGRRSMSIDAINFYADLLKIHPSWLLTGLGAKDKVVTRLIPILAWHEAAEFNVQKTRADHHKIIADRDVSPNSFALRLEDDAMEPRFPESAVIIIDPDEPYKNKDFVLVQPPRDKKPLCRMFVKGSPDNLAKAFNRHYETITITPRTTIIGKVVQVNLAC